MTPRLKMARSHFSSTSHSSQHHNFRCLPCNCHKAHAPFCQRAGTHRWACRSSSAAGRAGRPAGRRPPAAGRASGSAAPAAARPGRPAAGRRWPPHGTAAGGRTDRTRTAADGAALTPGAAHNPATSGAGDRWRTGWSHNGQETVMHIFMI